MRKRTQAREIALQILYQHEMNPGNLQELLDSYWENNHEVDGEIRTFTEILVKGTLDHLAEIDPVISKAADNWELSRMAVIDRNILRFATYEILFDKEIPAKVTINEAVNIAKKFSQIESGKFVNGILDKICHSQGSQKSLSDEKRKTGK